jgi:hypothetical protein
MQAGKDKKAHVVMPSDIDDTWDKYRKFQKGQTAGKANTTKVSFGPQCR